MAQPAGRFETIDIFNLEYVSDPQISPDGSKVIYVRNFKDIMTDKSYSNMWIVNPDGTENRPLTTGNQSDSYPRWSNDGTRVAYKSNREGSLQLYLRWIGSGAETKLTNLQQSPGSLSWSPDDQYLAFDMFVPKKSPAAIPMPAAPAGAKWNDTPVYIEDLRYRADGRGYLKEGSRQLFVLSTEGGTPHQVSSGEKDFG